LIKKVLGAFASTAAKDMQKLNEEQLALIDEYKRQQKAEQFLMKERIKNEGSPDIKGKGAT